MALNPFEGITLPEKHREELISIGAEAAEKRVDYSGKGIEKSREAVFKEVINSRIGVRSVGENQVPVPAPASPSPNSQAIIQDKSEKLQDLVNVAAIKGVVEASLEARKLGDPWLEDALHDALIGFHDELVKRGSLHNE